MQGLFFRDINIFFKQLGHFTVIHIKSGKA